MMLPSILKSQIDTPSNAKQGQHPFDQRISKEQTLIIKL